MKSPNIPLDVMIKDDTWSEHFPNPKGFCEDVVQSVCAVCDLPKEGELSIALVNDAEIKHLNKTYRGKDRPTNVLSFPDDGPAPILGDIVLALETVLSEAQRAGKKFTDHMTHLLVHGFLHLQGYDHQDAADAEIMEELEIKLLAKMNIDNPYIIKEPVRT